MLAETLESTSSDDRSHAVITAAGTTDWAQLAELYAERVERWKDMRATRIGLAFPASPSGLATLAALERHGKCVFLIDEQTSLAEMQSLGTQLGLHALIHADELNQAHHLDFELRTDQPPGSVTILTSGTTGKPKASQHSWRSLARPVRKTQPQRWLLAYRPHLYAGLQVVMQTLLNRGALVIPSVDAPPQEVADLMASSQTEYVSATPSYWRRLLLLVSHDTWNKVALKQITLGGEVVDQTILDQLSASFPDARLAHIYATTEVGRCFSVTDGRAGFPTSFLNQRSTDGIELKIEEQQLWVRSENAMTAYDSQADDSSSSFAKGEWFPTGDLVEVHEDRVYFAGRKSDMINVGGNKVHPVEVEQVIRELEGIAEVRVYPRSSSLAGQLVACDVVTKAGVDPESMRQQLIQYCHQRLARYQCPRVVEFVERLDLSAAGKMKRSD